MKTETFDLTMVFPMGRAGDPRARARLEKEAVEKIVEDVKQEGYVPVPETIVVRWSTEYQGTVTVMGTKEEAL